MYPGVPGYKAGCVGHTRAGILYPRTHRVYPAKHTTAYFTWYVRTIRSVSLYFFSCAQRGRPACTVVVLTAAAACLLDIYMADRACARLRSRTDGYLQYYATSQQCPNASVSGNHRLPSS